MESYSGAWGGHILAGFEWNGINNPITDYNWDLEYTYPTNQNALTLGKWWGYVPSLLIIILDLGCFALILGVLIVARRTIKIFKRMPDKTDSAKTEVFALSVYEL